MLLSCATWSLLWGDYCDYLRAGIAITPTSGDDRITSPYFVVYSIRYRIYFWLAFCAHFLFIVLRNTFSIFSRSTKRKMVDKRRRSHQGIYGNVEAHMAHCISGFACYPFALAVVVAIFLVFGAGLLNYYISTNGRCEKHQKSHMWYHGNLGTSTWAYCVVCLSLFVLSLCSFWNRGYVLEIPTLQYREHISKNDIDKEAPRHQQEI